MENKKDKLPLSKQTSAIISTSNKSSEQYRSVYDDDNIPEIDTKNRSSNKSSGYSAK